MARMTLELTEAVRARLDTLQERTSAASITEVIRRALAAYEVLVEHVATSGSVVLETPGGGRKVLVLPEVGSARLVDLDWLVDQLEANPVERSALVQRLRMRNLLNDPVEGT